MKYDFQAIERKWQDHWQAHRTFAVPNPGDCDFDPGRRKCYVLDMFPYPSGVGLHVGHPLGYIATDIVSRYRRMHGDAVLHPMGYDAFGLPAEQYAVETGVHPAETTRNNIETMTRQLRQLGLSYDWDRCVATTEPGYYRWTQWIFLQMYHSWYDPAQQKARPITELRTLLENGEYDVGFDGAPVPVAASGAMDALGGTPAGVRKWHELDEREQADVLDGLRLAFRDEVPVNWCPALGTVLANEEVTNDGRSERGNHPVEKRPLRQWMLRITAYCDRLLADLALVDWPEPIRIMQRNWIGRSRGAMVDFVLEGTDEVIQVFTTRPDTLFGATYMVLAPEHPLVGRITTDAQRADVEAYQRQAEARSDVDRMAETDGAASKTGVFTGAHAVNPTNGASIPVWIADYVLMGYGTGAIMAVPAHDQRDFEFAAKFDLPMRAVVAPDGDWLAGHSIDLAAYQENPRGAGAAFAGEGVSINSQHEDLSLDQLETPHAKQCIAEWLETRELGRAQVQYKLRDWLFSRQRYWGEPFPVLHGPDGEVVALDESELPVELPPMQDFKPHPDAGDGEPRPPLSRAPDDWRFVERDGVRYERELNTMPQWAGSCWYYLRFCDPGNDECFVDPKIERYWMSASAGGSATGPDGHGGVDLYVGGAEHAVLHLLYARFWHKVLYDLGHVSTPEPFGRLFNQGYIQAAAYTDERGTYVPAEQVEQRGDAFFHGDAEVTREFGKMGKSLKNAVGPEEMCAQYGCDSLRLYEMYLGPLDQSKPWRTQDIVGVHRFLQRVWRNYVDDDGKLLVDDAPAAQELKRLLHRTIKRVTDDMDRLSFNTAIAALIELNNALVALPAVPREVAETMLLLLAPMAPHVCEELWQRIGHADSLAWTAWPSYDEALLVEELIEVPVQVNGKLRGRIRVAADADQSALERAALEDDAVARAIEGRTVRKVVVVPGRLVNVVIG
ncbi:MAG: leucine--tRNA ligase [Phycisphaeraceae bacterium]|nr:leucine--tRNA ligase [Phycisphaeraceae bacterium]